MLWLFFRCGKRGLLSSRGAWTSHCVASLVAEYRLWGMWALVVATRGLSICSSQALEPRLNSCGSEA